MARKQVVVRLMSAFASVWVVRPALGDGCPGSPQQSIGPDVVVERIMGPSNYPVVGTRAAMTFGTDACNLGSMEVHWEACPETTHPVFGSNLYKWYTVNGATRFEQIGQSWLKHGFGADQNITCCTNCQPAPFTRLGRGCSDAYSSGQAGDQSSISPKYMVNAHTGVYPPEMCNIHPSGGNTGRLEVEISDLTPTYPNGPVRYVCQLQYITADDAAWHNQNNNATSREVGVSGSTNYWNFFFNPTIDARAEVPAIRWWKDLDTGVLETDVHTPEDDGYPGLVILDAKATDLGNGFWHYEYAVNNLNSDRSIGAVRVPCSTYATVQNIGFHCVLYRGGDGIGGVNFDSTSWPGAFANGTVTWSTATFASNANANAIRWGTLYNFRFDADVPPAQAGGNIILTEFKVVTDVVAASIVPSTSCRKGDLNGDGAVDGSDTALFVSLLMNGGGTGYQRCAGDVQANPDGVVDDADVAPFVNCLLQSSCL